MTDESYSASVRTSTLPIHARRARLDSDVAIDRFIGQVIDKQIEVVKE